MNTADKIALMDKIQRELQDVVNSQTSVLKKIAQVEADNINLGNKLLSDALPDIHEHVDNSITETNELLEKFKEVYDDFVAKNPVLESE